MTGIPGDKIAQAADRPVTALEYRPMECSPKNEEGSPVLVPHQFRPHPVPTRPSGRQTGDGGADLQERQVPIDPNVHLSRVVVTETAQGATHALGQMIAYQADPTVVIETGDGKQRSWLASLTRPATPEEAEQFWRDRALVAERKLKELAP